MVVLGKTNMDEFAMGSSTENSAYGPTRNPWDTSRIPGGSSGGSAAAVAAGQAPLAVGTDTGGSIRQPAAVCGIVGVKPTYGGVSRYGLVAFSSSLDQGGPFARTVLDAALLHEAIAGHDPMDSTSIAGFSAPVVEAAARRDVSGVRVGVVRELGGDGYEPEVEARFREAVAVLEELGAVVTEVSCPAFAFALPAYYLIAPSECSSNLARFDAMRYGLRIGKDSDGVEDVMSHTRDAGFGAEVKRRIMIGTYALSSGYYDAYYGQAQKVRTLISRDFAAAFEQVDVLVSPTTPTVAFPLGERVDDPTAMYATDLATVPANLAGVPALSLPCGLADGLPVGLQIMAPALADERMYRVAGALEAELDARRGGPLLSPYLSGGAPYDHCTRASRTDYEPVIGLETHVELGTVSKMFCGCPTAFGAEPNTQVCPVCLGLPGALPVVNESAVALTVRIGLALNCEIAPWCRFARKNYFYPDMPKNFQISQYDEPLCVGGYLDVEVGGEKHRVGITRVHMEEDTGKSLHVGGGDGRIHGATHSLLDYNRAGVPLVEIVTEPDIRSADGRRRVRHRAARTAAGIGGFRGPHGAGPAALRRQRLAPPARHRGVRHPHRDQEPELDPLGRAGGHARDRPAGRGARRRRPDRPGDPALRRGARRHPAGRTKEEATDYRYFPEPDLLPVALDAAFIDAIRDALPELPAARRARLCQQFGFSPLELEQMIGAGVLDLVEDTIAAGAEPDAARAWWLNELARSASERGVEPSQLPLTGADVARVIELIAAGTLTNALGRQVAGRRARW